MCVCVFCRLHAERNIGRPTYPTVELQRGIFKEKCIILTNDFWLIAIYFDEGPYEEVFSTIKEDLLTVEDRRRK